MSYVGPPVQLGAAERVPRPLTDHERALRVALRILDLPDPGPMLITQRGRQFGGGRANPPFGVAMQLTMDARKDRAESVFCTFAGMYANRRTAARWAGGRYVMDIRSSGTCYLATDPWHDLGCDQLNLAALVTHWPEVDSLAACAGIAGQQLRALVHRADADPAAKLRRVPFDQRTYNLGQDPFRI